MAKKKSRGRPPMDPAEAKSVMIPIRVTPEEAAAIQEAAKKASKPRSAWIRSQLRGATEPPAPPKGSGEEPKSL